MKIETLIYIYGAVCLCMIVFNGMYAIQFKEREPQIQKHYDRLEKAVMDQLCRIRDGASVDPEHSRFIEKKLGNINYLIAFERLISDITKTEPQQIRLYLQEIKLVLLRLAQLYLKREDMMSAYFTYFVSHCIAEQHIPEDELQEILLEYVKKKNLYCRVNALHALMNFGAVPYVAKAISLQDNEEVYLHSKILTECLLNFKGNHRQLIDTLLKNWDSYSVRTQLGIANYIRFCTGEYGDFMCSLLKNERADKELRLAAIRYFGRYPDQSILDTLLAFASDKQPSMWQYATVSVSALASYDGSRVLEVLKEGLHSGNWYIRSAAAKSLETHHATYSDLTSIMLGTDRYAKEMVMYRLEAKELLEAEESKP